MRGIILAGGSGTRLRPMTHIVSKQLLPVYDKPLIYYPLSVLMLARIDEILIISDPRYRDSYQRILGDGSKFGISLSYTTQDRPRGIADALRVGADFIGDENICLVLGDNIFYGNELPRIINEQVEKLDGCTLFGYPVAEPRAYGVAVLDPDSGRLVDLEEKPQRPRGNLAVTGLYLYTNDAVEYAAQLSPSARGELEITDLNRRYLQEDRAELVQLGRGFTWLDAGTPESLLEAATFVRMMQKRQGIQVACLEEVAFRAGLIDAQQLNRLIQDNGADSVLGQYLTALPAALGRRPKSPQAGTPTSVRRACSHLRRLALRAKLVAHWPTQLSQQL